MFAKRLINMLVSVPLMLFIGAALIVGTAYVGHQLDVFEQTFKPAGSDDMIVMTAVLAVGAAVFMALFLGALLAWLYGSYAFFTGDGLLYRRVNKGDSLQNADESVFTEFDKTEFIYRFSPMLAGRQLMFQSDF
jgi:hypothetical protein